MEEHAEETGFRRPSSGADHNSYGSEGEDSGDASPDSSSDEVEGDELDEEETVVGATLSDTEITLAWTMERAGANAGRAADEETAIEEASRLRSSRKEFVNQYVERGLLASGLQTVGSKKVQGSWKIVWHLSEQFKFMRLRDKRLFLCQLGATLDRDLQDAVLDILMPYLGPDTASFLAGPAPNLFNRDLQPFTGPEDKSSRRGSMSNTTGAEEKLMRHTNAKLMSCSSDKRNVRGPMTHQPHVHLTEASLLKRRGKRKAANQAGKSGPLQNASSMSSLVSGLSTVELSQRQHAPKGPSRQALLSENHQRGLVSFRVDKLKDPTGQLALKKLRRKSDNGDRRPSVAEQDRLLRLELLTVRSYSSSHSYMTFRVNG